MNRSVREAKALARYPFIFTVCCRENGKETKRQVEAYATVSEHFVVTRSVSNPKRWEVTHVHSGRTSMIGLRLRQARLIAAIMGALPMPWAEVTQDNCLELWRECVSGEWEKWRRMM